MIHTSFTLSEFIDAMEKNGLPQIYGDLWRSEAGYSLSVNNEGKVVAYIDEDDWDEMPIGAACAMGQGFINIGAFADFTDTTSLENYNIWAEFQNAVIYRNDKLHLDIPNIVAYVREAYKDHLDMVIPATKADFKIAESVG